MITDQIYTLLPNPHVCFEGNVTGRVLADHGATVQFELTPTSPPVFTNHYAGTTVIGRVFFVRPEHLRPAYQP